MSKPKHILVIRLSAMGDVAMTVPVLRAFSQQFPDVKLTVLTKPFFKPFFRDIPNVSVFGVETKGKHKGVLGLFKLSRELKVLKIDAVADLHNVLRTNVLKRFFLGTTFIQVDKGRAEKKALVKGKNFKQLKSTHQRYVDVFEKLGFKIDLSKPTFPKRAKLNSNIIKIVGEDSLKRIGIAPFAAFKGKMYSLDLMESVINALSQNYKILLFGGGNTEIETLKSLEAKFKNTKNISGKLTLDEELDLISNLDVMLCMDSGNAHIAAMLGVKVVTLWGVTHPYAGFYPFNQKKDNALLADRNQYPKIPTSVYGNKQPDGYQNAIETILPEQIISKINEVLK
ncbi:glycosyltransferase family 9 protein [Ichthyenterobacterium magnum]|uniref:ADP-heptose:LPS heptosyltransferase n=1 Tax=Ichthyenterobacterium magnum TaxID=1230530 RepID=A0A420DX81_9FLAO|nr:glycosyltransferase family 9 protein [Ichthyenterobacterium magnum]RKE98852.1 ADP-heptose:LPS heptosyltransferase [Ichthyenterobacterium magnum]